jgi:hypothetical protein
MSEREYAQLKRMLRWSKKSREFPWSRPPRIYRPPKQKESLESWRGTAWPDRMRLSDQPDVALGSGHYCPSARMVATCPCSNIIRWSLTVNWNSPRTVKWWLNTLVETTWRHPASVQSTPVSSLRLFSSTGCIRSQVTWRAQRLVRPTPPARNQSTLIEC